MVLAVINGVASTCRLTFVNRAPHFMVPCNLYNLVVAHSGQFQYFCLNLLDPIDHKPYIDYKHLLSYIL